MIASILHLAKFQGASKRIENMCEELAKIVVQKVTYLHTLVNCVELVSIRPIPAFPAQLRVVPRWILND